MSFSRKLEIAQRGAAVISLMIEPFGSQFLLEWLTHELEGKLCQQCLTSIYYAHGCSELIIAPARYQGSHFHIIFRVNHISSTSMIFSACEGMPVEVGSCVYFYNSQGQVVWAVVKSTSRMDDGTLLVAVRCDNGRTLTFP
ncbi:hypothetical protein IW262DRAFT_1302747 [Armillaria fumosa]|nr:hypothetical protein IW262DRAFT_1302747 [Armillaria fumosa]